MARRGKKSDVMILEKDLDSMLASDLRKLCKKMGVEGCEGSAYIKRDALILMIKDAQARSSGVSKMTIKTKAPKRKTSKAKKTFSQKKKVAPQKKKVSPQKKKKASPQKKVAKAKRKAPSKKSTGVCVPGSCPDQVCVLETGKCIKKTKAGLPYGFATLKKRYGNDYEFNEEHGIVGTPASIRKYIEEYGTPEPPKESPKRATKKRKPKRQPRCDDENDYLECEDGSVCDASSGRCESDSSSFRKGKRELVTGDGRIIIGNEETLITLQGILGGELTPVEKKKKKISSRPKPGPKESLEELLTEEEEAEAVEMERLLLEMQELKKGTAEPSPKRSAKKSAKRVSPKKIETSIDLKKQEIYDTFQKCLESLKA